MSAPVPGTPRFARLEELFHQATARAPSAREAFLAEACADDPALLTTLRDMLRHADADDTGLGASIGAVAEDLVAPADRSGERIGPYELTARIRYGGMAEVYAARRADGEFEQQVAIKIVRGDRPYGEMASLFQAERALMARLRHPHICQLFDGGTTERGEAFLVMERLVGAPLPQVCHEQSMPWRTVTAHFLDLCAALSHIHGQLIVHRDVKPDNVLIAEGPTGAVVKLLDFGIAARLADDGHAVTGRAGNWYSPSYAAPEVIAGEAGGVAVDVYALGCLLRDLAPRYAGGRRAEIERIAAKACATDPGARYASVEALAADVRRVRDQRPTSLPTARVQRLRLYVQRHALAIGVAGIAVVVVALTLWREVALRRAAEQATVVAVEERDKAAAIRDFLLEAYSAANPDINEGRDPRVSDMIEQQLTALDADRDLAAGTKIDLLHTLGTALMNLGRFERAEQSLAAATALVESTGETGSARWADIVIARAQNAQRNDRFDEAINLYRVVDEAPDAAWRRHDDADEVASRLYSSWSVVAQRMNRLEQAETLINRALTARRAHNAARGQAPELAPLLVTLGSIQSARANLTGALATFEEAYAENREHGRRYSFPHLALLGWIGITLDKLSQPERAEPYLREAVEVAERLFPQPHPKLSGAYGNLGMMYLVNGRLTEAAPLLQRGLDVLRQLGDERSAVYQSRLQGLARLALEREDLAAAAPLLDESLRLRRETFGAAHERTALALLSSASLALLQDQAALALAQSDEALAISRTLEASDNALLPSALITSAEAQAALGDHAAARRLLAEYREVAGSTPITARQRPGFLLQEARVLYQLGEVDDAATALRAVIAAQGGDAACTHPLCGHAALQLARIAAERGDLDEARARRARAAAVLDAVLVADAPSLRQLREIERRF